MSTRLWIPVTDADACSPPAAPGLSARERHDLAELHRLSLDVSLRPKPRELAEACDKTRHSPARLKRYVEDVRRDRASRRARRTP
jgi:hypothetical protein